MGLSEDFIDDSMFKVLSRLSECLCEELQNEKGPGLCYCGLWFGASGPPLGITDGGGDCGVAWVRLVSVFPSGEFPIADMRMRGSARSATACGSPVAYQVEIGVARPAPVPKGRDLFPDPQDVFDAARLYMGDMRAAKRALVCCLPQKQRAAREQDVITTAEMWNPIENSGGRSGGTWTGFIGWN